MVLGQLRDLPRGAALAAGVAASSITHPLLWYAWPRFGPDWLWLGTGEGLVWAFEGVLYGAVLARGARPDPWRRGLLTSVYANAVSTAVGLLLQR